PTLNDKVPAPCRTWRGAVPNEAHAHGGRMHGRSATNTSVTTASPHDICGRGRPWLRSIGRCGGAGVQDNSDRFSRAKVLSRATAPGYTAQTGPFSRRQFMLKLIIVLSLLIVTVSPGFTQSRDPSIGTGNVDRAVPQAPVGHRQPRAGDVPQ